MKKTGFIALALLFVLVLSSCTTSMYYGSGLDEPAEFMGEVEITIGPFLSKATVRAQLIAAAREMYGDQVDDVVDVSMQKNTYGQVFWNFLVEGKAINYLNIDTYRE